VKTPAFPDSYSIPFSIPGSQRDRQLLHFYSVQSALDLGGSLNRDLWYNIVLQYTQQHAAVRQAVIAFGSMHWHGLSMPQNDELEHIKQYNRAIRAFRKYISPGSRPDPHVVLLCTALFFNYESGRGDPKRALEHLESGLKFLKNVLNQQPSSKDSVNTSSDRLAVELINPSILHLFSRLDFQASVYDDNRIPVLPLMQEFETPHPQPFHNIQEIQNSLGILLSRTLRFLVCANEYKYFPENDIPSWIRSEKYNLLMQFALWDERIQVFTESPHYNCCGNANDGAAQIRGFKIHHRLCRMLLQSSFPHNPEVFTQRPNAEVEEILVACETMAQPLRITMDKGSQDGGAWKFTSEIAILPPLILLAVKSSDSSIRRRAIDQIELLGGYREGLLDAKVACQVLFAAQNHAEATPLSATKPEAQTFLSTDAVVPASTSDSSIAAVHDAFAHVSLEDSPTSGAIFDEPGGLNHWAKLLGVA